MIKPQPLPCVLAGCHCPRVVGVDTDTCDDVIVSRRLTHVLECVSFVAHLV